MKKQKFELTWNTPIVEQIKHDLRKHRGEVFLFVNSGEIYRDMVYLTGAFKRDIEGWTFYEINKKVFVSIGDTSSRGNGKIDVYIP